MRKGPAAEWHDAAFPVLMALCGQHIPGRSTEGEEWKREKPAQWNRVCPKPQIILLQVEGQTLTHPHKKAR